MYQNIIFESYTFFFLNHQKNKQIQILHMGITRTFTIINDWVEVSTTSLKYII